MAKKWLGTVLATLLVLMLAMGIGDFARINRFEMPVFARPTETMDDGGSGLYRGIGYSIRIEGNFLPEEEFPGVTQYEFRVLGLLISAEIRD